MWLCLPDSFLSVVHKDCDDDELLVRARRAGDIEKVFPEAKVIVNTKTDYMYRARVKREVVADAIFTHVMTLDYPNFKNEVADHDLHNAYSGVWSIMYRLQNAWSGRGRQKTLRELY